MDRVAELPTHFRKSASASLVVRKHVHVEARRVLAFFGFRLLSC
jgi:hypothetical protein